MKIILFIFSVLWLIAAVNEPSEITAFLCALMGLFALSMAESYDRTIELNKREIETWLF